MNIISTKNLSYSYKKGNALRAINLDIPKGVITGLIGHNGSGKSTLLKILLNELQPTSGFVINKAQKQGFIIENGSFYDHLSAVENLKFSYYLHNTPISSLYEILDLVGLKNDQHNKVSEYSLGMKKRLSIAMAFVSKPDLILLDEPTNELDPDGIVLLNEIISIWNKKYGSSIIYCSHQLPEVSKISDFLMVLNKGEIVYQGFRENLEQLIGTIGDKQLEHIYENLKQTA